MRVYVNRAKNITIDRTGIYVGSKKTNVYNDVEYEEYVIPKKIYTCGEETIIPNYYIHGRHDGLHAVSVNYRIKVAFARNDDYYADIGYKVEYKGNGLTIFRPINEEPIDRVFLINGTNMLKICLGDDCVLYNIRDHRLYAPDDKPFDRDMKMISLQNFNGLLKKDSTELIPFLLDAPMKICDDRGILSDIKISCGGDD